MHACVSMYGVCISWLAAAAAAAAETREKEDQLKILPYNAAAVYLVTNKSPGVGGQLYKH